MRVLRGYWSRIGIILNFQIVQLEGSRKVNILAEQAWYLYF